MHCYVKGLLFGDQYMHSQYFHVLNSKHSECGIPITTSKVCILISKMKCVALISYLRYTLCLHWQFFEHCVMCNLVIYCLRTDCECRVELFMVFRHSQNDLSYYNSFPIGNVNTAFFLVEKGQHLHN